MVAAGETRTAQGSLLRLNADGRCPITEVMQVTRPRLLAPVAFAAFTTFLMAWVGLGSPGFNDFDNEALPPYTALRAGDIAGFFDKLPGYGGSLLMRAPAVLISDWLGGGDDALFRAVSIPCLLALAVLGVALFSLQDRPAAAWLTLAVVTLNPLTLRALETGHAEELLGAALCTGAVLVALRGRPIAAGVLLGLAIGNKAWALLAIGPVALALRSGYARAAAATVLAGALTWGPVLVASAGRAHPAPVTGAIFQPWQVWWFTGEHGHEVRGITGAIKPGFRAAPTWLSAVPHPLIVGVGFALSAAAAAVRGRRREDALLLLALVLFVRCWLDPWNTTYYVIPAVTALAAWEAMRGRMPLGALALTGLSWLTLQTLPGALSPDLQAAAYLAWALPFTGLLALRVFAPATARAQLTKVRLFGSPLSTSAPVSVTATRSSMRTPTAPGR